MRPRSNHFLRTLAFTALLASGAAAHSEEAPITSTWKVQEIKYSYVAFTTAYDCDSAEAKLKSILLAVGAHPSTKVRAAGCQPNRPDRNFFITITTATPVPVAEVKPSAADQSKQELLKRLGTKSDFSSEEFPATWKTVNLAKDRKLDLGPGDCELMEGLRDKVLPKLGVKITEQRISCTPNQVGIATPPLTVSALVAQKSPDEKTRS